MGGTYLCIEGPHFSTRAESELYRSWGMDIIGMTNLQEAKLAREAEICYSTLAMVTDYDCWHPDHDSVTAEYVIGNLGKNAATAKAVLRAAVRRLLPGTTRDCECANALRSALVTPAELVPDGGQEGAGADHRAVHEVRRHPRRGQRGLRHRGDALRPGGEGAGGERLLLLRGRLASSRP